MTKQEKALAKELTRRIRMYERLIEKPETLNTEEIQNCTICRFVYGDCNFCILNTMDGTYVPCMTEVREELWVLSHYDNAYVLKDIPALAKHRLKEMLKAIKAGGFIYGV